MGKEKEGKGRIENSDWNGSVDLGGYPGYYVLATTLAIFHLMDYGL